MKILEPLKLIGPNRRSERTVIEVWLKLTSEEATTFRETAETTCSQVIARLAAEGVDFGADSVPGNPGALQYADLLGRTALALQRHAGHRVGFHQSLAGAQPEIACMVVEFEHGDAGLRAVRLALRLLEEENPAVGLGPFDEDDIDNFSSALREFMEAAPGQLLPRQTQDIIDAAERRDIPWVKLDRDPYQGVAGDFRIRPNGMLKLGQACHQRVLDGPLPVDAGEWLVELAHDRASVLQFLESAGAPIPRAVPCTTARQAVRAAGQIGLPVALKPRRINRARRFGATQGPLLRPEDVKEAAGSLLQYAPGLIVESWVEGEAFCALLAHGTLLGIFTKSGGIAASDVTARAHPRTAAWLVQLSQRVGAPLLGVEIVAEDISSPLDEAGAVVGLDVAPDLDRLLPTDAAIPAGEIRRRAADGLVAFLFAEGENGRIPLIAVTGTNGKSTVCYMIARVMQHAGYDVGRAGSTGLYTGGRMIEAGDFSGGKGHHRILELPEVNLAVLETARGAVSGLGLMFDHCDTAVCTNVTRDHLGERGVETVEDMAELKLFIMSRARQGVVLNADNAFSAGMLPELAGRKAWIVSRQANATQLQTRFGPAVNVCIAEASDDGERITLIDGGESRHVMLVGEIPATMGGRARFNVSNALQAIAACYQSGVSLNDIRAGMATCANDFDENPGRLNYYGGLPFEVLLDFAHNEDSHRALRDFVDTFTVSGRKLLLLVPRGNIPDEEFSAVARIVSKGYDRFICCEHPRASDREPGETPELMKQALVDHGVPESHVKASERDDALEIALRLARPGDLLVATTTTLHLHEDWDRIRQFDGNNAIERSDTRDES